MSIDTNQHPDMIHQQHYLEQLCAAGRISRYHIITFGCQLNENDSEKLAGLLEQAGMTSVENVREADLVILNTCSVRENADDRLFGHLGMMKNIRRDRPDVLVGLCGCMMAQPVHRDKVRKSYPFVDFFFGPQDIHKLPYLITKRLFEGQKSYLEDGEDIITEDLPIVRARKYRALVSIMFGCNNYCSYCIVPYTRGRERSRRPERILQEIRQLVDEGFKEVLLLGQNVNSYGHDLKPSPNDAKMESSGREDSWNFARLLRSVAEIPDLYRVRFMTSHPKDLSDDLIEVIARHPNIERHLHLPLQSGSSRTLKDMNRKYDRDRYLGIIQRVRERVPDISLSTDIIVGFPGETEADFSDTLDLMERVRFDSAFTFQYSKRVGTPAANREDQVPESVVKERFERLVRLQNAHSLAANEAQVGKSVEVLIEGASATALDILTGRGSDFRLVNFKATGQSLPPDPRSLEGRIAIVRITRAKTFSLEGEMEQLLP